MVQISEGLGSLPHPSPEFWYDKHTPSQKRTEWCPSVRHFIILQCISSGVDCTVLPQESITLHLPLDTQIENCLGNCWSQSTGECAVTCRPRNSGECHRFRAALLSKHSPHAQRHPSMHHAPPLTPSGLHAMSGMREPAGCSMPEPCTVHPRYTTRL